MNPPPPPMDPALAAFLRLYAGAAGEPAPMDLAKRTVRQCLRKPLQSRNKVAEVRL